MPSKIKPTAFRVRPPLKAKLVEAAKTRASVHATALEAMEMGLDLMLMPQTLAEVYESFAPKPGEEIALQPVQKALRESVSVTPQARLDKSSIGKRLDGGKKASKK